MVIFVYALFMCTGGLGCQPAEGPYSKLERCLQRRDELNVQAGPYHYVCRVSDRPQLVPEVPR